MRRLASVAFILSVLTPVGFLPSVRADIVFAETSVKTDKVPADGIIVSEFPFTNTGDTTVTISEVATSCGCTVPELTKKVYAPGEKGVITTKFTVGDRQGLQTKLITVRSDASAQVLRLDANLPVRLMITPRLLIFREDNREPLTMSLKFQPDAPVELIGVESLNPNFEVSVKTNTKGLDYTLNVSMVRTPEQSERGNIRITSKGATGLEYNDIAFVRYAP